MAEYNGWRNYETWAAHLWLTNDEGTDRWVRETVQEAYKAAREEWVPSCINDHDRGRHRASEALRGVMEEQMPDLDASLWFDLLRAAFSEVDWQEVADALLPEGVDA